MSYVTGESSSGAYGLYDKDSGHCIPNSGSFIF